MHFIYYLACVIAIFVIYYIQSIRHVNSNPCRGYRPWLSNSGLHLQLTLAIIKKGIEISMADNTIFDDIFHTMVEKMPQLVIPLINEVFRTSYPESMRIVQLRNEHHDTKSGEVITDTCLKIGTLLYHIECQSTDDTTMAIRMIEYDSRVAMEHAQKIGRRYRICLPRACVV